MASRKAVRLGWIGAVGVVLAVAVGLSLFAMRSGISFAMSPSELAAADVAPAQRVRLFGLVEEGSRQDGEGTQVSFVLGDGTERIAVDYDGALPDLFREGQGIITEGYLAASGRFSADRVLAKHDENYMPADMAEKLKQEGVWQGEAGS